MNMAKEIKRAKGSAENSFPLARFLCPVQRPLGEYVRSSEESGCKCHARMSICRHFPSAKHEESATQRRRATAAGQDSECLEHCESARGAEQCAASYVCIKGGYSYGTPETFLSVPGIPFLLGRQFGYIEFYYAAICLKNFSIVTSSS